MSDLMLLGVLRMPMDDAGPLEVFQYVARGRQAADEIERLRAERDAAFAISKCQCGTEEACANLAKLRAEVAGLREDAERYRWLRKDRETGLICMHFGNGCINKTIDMVDAAIDAARKGSHADQA